MPNVVLIPISHQRLAAIICNWLGRLALTRSSSVVSHLCCATRVLAITHNFSCATRVVAIGAAILLATRRLAIASRMCAFLTGRHNYASVFIDALLPFVDHRYVLLYCDTRVSHCNRSVDADSLRGGSQTICGSDSPLAGSCSGSVDGS